jgi:sigma-B regulation protein RsbU (phosphoserine phosphatase)
MSAKTSADDKPSEPLNISENAEKQLRRQSTFFRSIKTKILTLIIAILIATSLVMMLFTQREVDIGMTNLEEQSARNAIHLSVLNLNSSYNDLLFYRKNTLETRKKELKDIISISENIIRNKMRKVERKEITLPAAKKAIAEEFRKLTYGNNDYIWVSDYSSRLISHPDPKLHGVDYSQVRDVRGNLIVAPMVEAALKNGEGFYSYWWRKLGEPQPSEKLSYFKHLPEWKWVIVTGVYIDEIERQSQKKMEAMIQGLAESFAKVRIAQTGYMYIFDGKKKMIIHPSLSGKDVTTMKNPSTGNPLTEDLIKAAATPDKPYVYLWDKPTDSGNYSYLKESYVEYFAPLDWYLVSTVYRDEIKQPARTLIMRQVAIGMLILLVSLGFAYVLVVRIASPLKKLGQYAKEFPTQDLTSSEKHVSGIENFPEKYNDEVGRLAESFIYMEQSLRDYIRKLTDTTAAKERIESELSIAREIQMSILPKIFPPFPERQEFDVHALIEPAKEVGGDFYDFFLIDDKHFCFVIGDVSGKGVPASLFMAVTKTLIKATAMQKLAPDEILYSVNQEISRDNNVAMFVTIFCGILDTQTGEIVYANGGHNLPIVMQQKKGVFYLEKTGDCAIGAMEGSTYRQARLHLEPGDKLFLYTDGVTEAMNTDKMFFSEDNLLAAMEKLRAEPVKGIILGVMQALSEFTSGAPQYDDITMTAIHFYGKDNKFRG